MISQAMVWNHELIVLQWVSSHLRAMTSWMGRLYSTKVGCSFGQFFFSAPATMNGDIVTRVHFEALQHAMKQLEVSSFLFQMFGRVQFKTGRCIFDDLLQCDESRRPTSRYRSSLFFFDSSSHSNLTIISVIKSKIILLIVDFVANLNQCLIS